MPRNSTSIRRKYAYENNKPKNLCQIYRIKVIQNDDISQPQVKKNETQQNGNKAVRINKNIQLYHVPIWAEINQRQEFGYAILPESPITCFNNNEDNDENDATDYEPQNKSKLYSWEQVDTNEDWIQY